MKYLGEKNIKPLPLQKSSIADGPSFYGNAHPNGVEQPEENAPEKFQLAGRCFNATLSIQKHIQRCPWCPDPNVQIDVVGGGANGGTGTGEQSSEALQRNDTLAVQNLLILALSGAVVFSVTGSCDFCFSFFF